MANAKEKTEQSANFHAEISRSSMELTAKERIKYKTFNNAVKLDEVIQPDNTLKIGVKGYVVLNIHNEKSDNKDYESYLIIANDDTVYSTGSDAFFHQFEDIYNELKDEKEPWELLIFKCESKNYKGKYFITCNVA